jgi:hypothetical protein
MYAPRRFHGSRDHGERFHPLLSSSSSSSFNTRTGRSGVATARHIVSLFRDTWQKLETARKSSVVRDDRCALLQSTWTIGVDGSTSRLATDIVLRTGRSVTLPSRWMSKFDVDVVRKDSHQSRMCRWSLPSASWSGRRMNSVHQPQDLR